MAGAYEVDASVYCPGVDCPLTLGLYNTFAGVNDVVGAVKVEGVAVGVEYDGCWNDAYACCLVDSTGAEAVYPCAAQYFYLFIKYL